MSFCVDPKSKQLWGNTHENVVVQWMCGSGSWWTGHIRLRDCLFSVISLQIWVGMFVHNLCFVSLWRFILALLISATVSSRFITVRFPFFGERHLYLIFLSLSPSHSSVSLSLVFFLHFLRLICIFFSFFFLFTIFSCATCLLLSHLSNCRVAMFTAWNAQTWLVEQYHVGWLNLHAIGLCVSSSTKPLP